ncbi:hypothetical protein TNCT_26691 [Trichonephila clavata]|uniref:Uncharacterized protein n=1 Tax=Trichonephila clavata TaxID=2740835 RepID=A0A8X6LLC4_TRICU|nr:hypothetical protein TNCT_26691 [Trichonephila clavata]
MARVAALMKINRQVKVVLGPLPPPPCVACDALSMYYLYVAFRRFFFDAVRISCLSSLLSCANSEDRCPVCGLSFEVKCVCLVSLVNMLKFCQSYNAQNRETELSNNI